MQGDLGAAERIKRAKLTHNIRETFDSVEPETLVSLKKEDIVEIIPGSHFSVVSVDSEFARLEERMVQLEEKVEILAKEAAIANKEAAKANKEVAKANKEVAIANKEAAKANKNFTLLSQHLESQAIAMKSQAEATLAIVRLLKQNQ